MNLRGPDETLTETVVSTLHAAWMPGDWFELTPQVAKHYAWKASIARDAFVHCWRPQPFRIVEIGTRCGYSLRAFHAGVTVEANKADKVDALCIDAGIDVDSAACLGHFLRWVHGNAIPARLVVTRTASITALFPAAHFAHVDGDHSFHGCLHDLQLVSNAAVILVDDCDNPEVKRAVDAFLRDRPERRAQFINDGLRVLAVLELVDPISGSRSP